MLNLFSCFFCLWSSQAWITLDRAQLNFGEPDSATENFLRAIAIKPDDSKEAQDDRHSASLLVKRGVPFNRAYGMTAFQYPGTDQRFNRLFNQAMPNHTPFIMKRYLRRVRWTLHDWSDEHCLKLLKNSWEALPSNGKVIFVESLLPVAPENIASSHVVFEQDLCMLARNPGGMEFEALAKKSGFSGCEVICCAYNSWVMEFQKDSTAIN
ncbi:hypothetical protein Peur_013820 [Populus x canadensis]